MSKRNEIAKLREEVETLKLVLTRLYHAVDPVNITYSNDGGKIPHYVVEELSYAMLEAKEFIN